jgi:uncharacterized protein (TIGR03067 family)
MQGHWTPTHWSMEVKVRRWRRRGQPPADSEILINPNQGTAKVIVAADRLRVRAGRSLGRDEDWILRPDFPRTIGPLSIVNVETGQVMLGIYKFRGDTLVICYHEPGKGRPSQFNYEEQWMLVLKREG